MILFDFQPGSLPLLLSVPHAGTDLPTEIGQHFTEVGRKLPDTDWFVDRLYRLPELENASRIVARISRYVVDLNRPRDDDSLYPGQNTTGLFPLMTFDGQPIYVSDQSPSPDELRGRIQEYWDPYHQQIRHELDRLIAQSGSAILLEAHSIASRVPRLFDGTLPDFNFGTNRGRSCGADLQLRIEGFGRSLAGYSHVMNGRFVGGYTTRHYGEDPNVNAVQLELSQATYMDESTVEWDKEKAERVQKPIRSFVQTLIESVSR